MKLKYLIRHSSYISNLMYHPYSPTTHVFTKNNTDAFALKMTCVKCNSIIRIGRCYDSLDYVVIGYNIDRVMYHSLQSTLLLQLVQPMLLPFE